ncbi:hypothetical protein PPL_06084 [Heterostelium album PN500]|uniref:B box-type domain-containing protein n=1 Tax=Heterostelium pallidum (strain ATCC 26659 / Pp 5 / PN500) TaxID=670386 RepID=D3BC62_HETP5|nr:hypothetical protein PPL_06084 [Heterostelium album PN500]EFA81245.1 hypothetical protein PPL_06084 [Heterostelium album PN500]|eukprot:XP_020433363.1 hypothetical protein PPL_06084 [Heterostelium album PN500]
MEIFCSTHVNQRLQYICFDCNFVGCLECMEGWQMKHKGHCFQSVSTIMKEIVLDADPNSNKFISRMNHLWKSLKVATHSYESLTKINSDISDHFRALHDYLILEESRIRLPINNDLAIVKQDIDNQFQELKSLQTLINKCLETRTSININNINNEEKVESDVESVGSESLSDEEVEHEDNYDYKSYNSKPIIDLSDMETLVSLIEKSDSHSEFMKTHKDSIFSRYGTDEYENELGGTLEESILNLIHHFNSKYNSLGGKVINSNSNSQVKCNFTIKTNSKNIEEAKYNIQKSIHLHSISIYTLGHNESSLFNLADGSRKSIETFKGVHTTNSIVSDPSLDHIYVFGGFELKSYKMISTKTMEVEHFGVIEDVDGGEDIFACYDGFEYIYLIGGYNYKNKKTPNQTRIDRFNIATRKFENYSTLHYQIAPNTIKKVFQSNGHIYIVNGCYNARGYSIWRFNAIAGEKQLTLWQKFSLCISNSYHIPIMMSQSFLCFDAFTETLYLFYKNYLYRINVRTKDNYRTECKFDHILFSTEIKMSFSVLFNRVNSNQANIFILGGKTLGNHVYSVESNKWSPLLENKDNCQREMCGACIISN